MYSAIRADYIAAYLDSPFIQLLSKVDPHTRSDFVTNLAPFSPWPALYSCNCLRNLPIFVDHRTKALELAYYILTHTFCLTNPLSRPTKEEEKNFCFPSSPWIVDSIEGYPGNLVMNKNETTQFCLLVKLVTRFQESVPVSL